MSRDKARGVITVLSLLAVAASLFIEHELAALLILAVCIMGAVAVLFFHLEDLTDISADNPKLKTLKQVTAFDLGILAVCVLLVLLMKTGVVTLPAEGEKYFAAALVSVVMIFTGNIAPKLPHSRHTGLRLPWTVADEETWLVAHRLLGYTSIPLALFYIAAVPIVEDLETLTLAVIVLWAGIPGALSWRFYYKKCTGR